MLCQICNKNPATIHVQEIINGHAVDSWASFVRLDLLIGAVQVIAFKDGF